MDPSIPPIWLLAAWALAAEHGTLESHLGLPSMALDHYLGSEPDFTLDMTRHAGAPLWSPFNGPKAQPRARI